MNVRLKVYETPQPNATDGETLQHVRVNSKGTRHLNEMCEELVPLGLNTAQIKGVLDGISRYVGRSLKEGYRVELEGLGIFSLSVSCKQITKDSGKEAIAVAVDGVNFRSSKQLKARVKEATLVIEAPLQQELGVAERKAALIAYLQKNNFISCAMYARLNHLSGYRANKDLKTFVQEGLIVVSGLHTHKVYFLA